MWNKVWSDKYGRKRCRFKPFFIQYSTAGLRKQSAMLEFLYDMNSFIDFDHLTITWTIKQINVLLLGNKKEINLLRDTYHFTSFVPKEDKQNQKTSFWDDQTPLCLSTYNIVDYMYFVQHFFTPPAKALFRFHMHKLIWVHNCQYKRSIQTSMFYFSTKTCCFSEKCF